MAKKVILFLSLLLLTLPKLIAQEENPFVTYDVPAQNLLKFNRFLINPTFSTVREDKSYMNLLHRNQSVSFDDNNQAYFLSYSGRINDRTGLGLSLYNQREGIISNFGVLANYAYGVKLSDKSNFTFGANISYYSSGLDRNRVNSNEIDPYLNGLQESNLISFQPGFNLSYGNFDFGLFAENLFDYNLKSSSSVTDFVDKTYSGHLQYTHQFKNMDGVMEGGRIMPLARVRKVGQDNLVLGGGLILDLPKIGWLQAGYDDFYGAAAGVGFNLNRRLSLGYTMEKGLSNNFDNFGLTHEISFAYSFTPNLTEDRVMLEDDYDDALVKAENSEDILDKDLEIEALKQRLAENDAILAELMFRQDSLEDNRQKDLEKRFDMVMRMVRNETKGNRPDLEERAKTLYFDGQESATNIGNSQLALENHEKQEENICNGNRTQNITPIKKDVVEVISQEDTQLADVSVKEEPREITETIETEEPKPVFNQVKDIIKTPEKTSVAENDSFEKAAKKNNVKSRKFRNLEGVDSGYYVVANVYKGDQYLHKFIDELKQQGIEADYFTNPENGLKYVYLKKFDKWQEALDAHQTNFSGSYNNNLWIMDVDNDDRYSNEAWAANDTSKNNAYDDSELRKNVIVQDKIAKNEVPTPQSHNIDGAGSGYYIIANVFSKPSNANRFVRLLNTQGLNASYFINPENNYRYVYLKKHDSWNKALVSYYSKLNNAYDDKMWIMRVKHSYLT